jgi:hypothetical protein
VVVDPDADADETEKNVRPILGVSGETSILRAAPPRGRAFRIQVREENVGGMTTAAVFVFVAVAVAARWGARRGRTIRIDTEELDRKMTVK